MSGDLPHSSLCIIPKFIVKAKSSNIRLNQTLWQIMTILYGMMKEKRASDDVISLADGNRN
jgi:hypothetical protein